MFFCSQGIHAASAARRARHIAPAEMMPSAVPPPSDAPLAALDLKLTDDWTSTRSPLKVQAVRQWLQDKLSGTHLPAGWLDAASDAASSVSSQDDWLDDEARRQAFAAYPSLVTTHKNPFLRFVIWAAVRDKPVDIAQVLEEDLARFAVSLNIERRNTSAARSAVAAVNFVRKHNKLPIFEGAAVKGAQRAAVVAFSSPTKKAPEINVDFIADMVLSCCADGQPDWRFMFGVCILALFLGMCRFSDLGRLRYDPGFLDDFGTHLRFFIDHRKNDPLWKGHYFDVAVGDGYRGVIASDIFLAAKLRFGSGPLLRRVWLRGSRGPHLAPPFIETGPDKGELRTMFPSDFHTMLRTELMTCCNFTAKLADEYTSHGGRAAAASELSRSRLPHGQINARAGVVSENWLAGYDRLDLDRRLQTARALRFC